jgi:hypothetical protein
MKMRTARRAPGERPVDLHQLIDSALPKRELFLPEKKLRVNGKNGKPERVLRRVLITMIVREIQAWQKRAKWIEAHPGPRTERAEKHRQMISVADKLTSQLETAKTRLVELGALQLVVIDPIAAEFKGHSAGRSIYFTCDQALRSLQRWNHFNRPKKGPRPVLSAMLTSGLELLCCRQAGCSVGEFETLLSHLNARHGLPLLTRSTLKKRKHREKKKAGTI